MQFAWHRVSVVLIQVRAPRKPPPRCFVNLISNLSDSDGSEIQVDVVDLAPGSRPFFEESTPAAGFGPPLES